MLLSNLALASSLQATFQATVGNAEIQNIIQILGLDLGKISPLKGSAGSATASESH